MCEPEALAVGLFVAAFNGGLRFKDAQGGFNLFAHPDPSNPTAVTAAIPEMTRPAERYLTTENRDFFTISRRD